MSAPSERATQASVALVLGLAAACFPQFVAAGPHLYDAGELAAASVFLGGSHPPGQPLHALLAHFVLWLPLGPIPARIALFSAACALCAAAVLAVMTRELGGELGASARMTDLGAGAAAAALLLASPVLRQALRVEVYSLALALALGSCLALVRFAQGAGRQKLALAAFLAGLAGCVHPPHALACALFALGLCATRPALFARNPAAALATCAGFGLLGLLGYAYLPARAAAGAPMWGDPLHVRGFFSYVSGRAYLEKNLTASSRPFALTLLEYVAYSFQHGAAAAVFCVAGLTLVRRDPRNRVATRIALGAALALLSACIHPLEVRNPDNIAYVATALGLSLAAGTSAAAAVLSSRTARATRALFGAGLAALALQPLGWPRLRETLRADLPGLETLAGSLLETPPPRAMVVATSDFAAASWMLAQSADGARPDCALFVTGLATSSWQWKSLAQHPGLRARPTRGPGRDRHEQYLNGALLLAMPHVPIAFERETSFDASRLSGPYLLLAREKDPDLARAADSIGERLAPVLDRDFARSPDGDYGAGAAIARDYQQRRALRLLELGLVREALKAIAASLWPLPAKERGLFERAASRALGPLRPLPPRVIDPGAFLVTLEDQLLLGAAVLEALGEHETVGALLEAEVRRGKPRALLQRAWFELARGDREAARGSLERFVRVAPELASEARPLAKLL